MRGKNDKIIIIGLVMILILLFFDMIYNTWNAIDYKKRKNSGNEHWLQVENRILQTEYRVNMLEKGIGEWKKY